MAVLQKVKINNEWVPVSGSNVNSGGGGITEEKEIYIGTTPTEEAKIWIDPTGTPSGGNGGGLETRILYVPELTAGSELTDEQKAYNVETCQKLMEGTARTYVSNGLGRAYADSIIDTSGSMGAEYVIYFDTPALFAIGGYVIDKGDIIISIPPPSPSVILTEGEGTMDTITALLMYSLGVGALPTFYIAYKGTNYMATNVVAMSNGIGITYEDDHIFIFALSAGGDTGIVAWEFPNELTVGSSDGISDNALWISNKGSSYSNSPVIKHHYEANILYTPIYINRYTTSDNYADFAIMRNGALEVWRIDAEGKSSLIK